MAAVAPLHPEIAPGVVRGRWWQALPDGRVQCDLCPRHCRLHEGQRAFCYVREARDGGVVLTSWGRASGFCIDPIEKKPLNHFYPGSSVLSFGTAGCNLGCKFCVPGETWIATGDGMRRINELFDACPEKVSLGEGRAGFPLAIEVWTRESKRVKVSKVFSRPFDGTLVSLRAAGCPPILATPNHGIFAAHRSDLGTVREIPAAELTTDHFLVVPKRRPGGNLVISTREWLSRVVVRAHAARPRRVVTAELEQVLRLEATSSELGRIAGYHPTYVRKLRSQLRRGALAVAELPRTVGLASVGGRVRFKGERGHGVPERLEVSPELAWLLGVFCAEGCVSSHGGRPNSFRLLFCFGHHEEALASRTTRLLAALLDARPRTVRRRTTLAVECGQTSVARLFEALCGRGARNKQVPTPVRDGSETVIRAFLDGYLAGDGHRTTTHAVALTVSEKLALGLFELGLHLDLLPTYFEHTPAPTREIEGRTVSQSRNFIVKYLLKRFSPEPGQAAERARWRDADTAFLSPIRKIDRVPYRGEVYNLEVDDPDHSYLAPFLAVANCQNWDISKAREDRVLAASATPERVVDAAAAHGSASIAFTYNDPVIFAEYAIDCAREARARGVHTVAVSAGYITPEARGDFYEHMDAANIDLKGFTEEFYAKTCAGHLDPVRDTLVWLHRETSVWLEVTTLLIPGLNDSEPEIAALCDWFLEHLGPDVPLHFTAFHPDFRMTDRPHTPPATLRRARRQALDAGLRHVYTGNIRDGDGQSTYCTGCGALVIGREGYTITGWRLDAEARCAACGTRLAGHFAPQPGTWGARRLPIAIGR